MLLKPGWIIVFLTFWLVMQLIITVGDAFTYGANTPTQFGTGTLGQADSSGQAISTDMSNLQGQAPMVYLFNHVVVFFQKGLIAGIAAIATDFGGIWHALGDAFTFQADFWPPGSGWFLIPILLMCIYAGFTIAAVWSFFAKVF